MKPLRLHDGRQAHSKEPALPIEGTAWGVLSAVVDTKDYDEIVVRQWAEAQKLVLGPPLTEEEHLELIYFRENEWERNHLNRTAKLAMKKLGISDPSELDEPVIP